MSGRPVTAQFSRLFFRRRRLSARGSALLYVIASIALLGAVGGGVAYFSSSSSTSQLSKTHSDQAYYAAISGLRYAPKADLAAMQNSTTTYSLGNNVAFKMTVGTKTASAYPVTVCGIYGAGTSMEANYQLAQVSVTPGSGTDEPEYGSYDIRLPGDASQTAGAKSAHTGMANKLIKVVTEGDEDYEGTAYVRLGNRTTQGYACLWFNDTKTVQEDSTYCQNGVCKFGKGFRLYFEFQVVSAGADGFTVSFINATNNTVNDCGGDLSMGELLGYGGPGLSGHGLRPGKIALEVDTFQNGSGYCTGAGSREDDDDGHLAYVYWGAIDDDSWWGGCNTYDDNQHTAGGNINDGEYTIDGKDYRGSPKKNPLYNTVNLENTKIKLGSNRTYKRISNLEDGAVHTVRMEVTRATNANGSGAYSLKTWVDCTVSGEPCEGIKKLTEDFTAKNPDLISSFTMDKYFHGLLNTFLVGFTEATGDSAQEVRLMNFYLKFRE
ncbi:hypothetical protein [Desulfolutivibrio sp.]|uniref:hypothetical protein n=1 Tax=Desulfolutivibrio sp. TaxID=2773296 RepID=UPI002F968A8E